MPTTDLYLSTNRSGLAWQLDPAAPGLTTLAAAALSTTAESSCDGLAVADDLDVFARLLVARHFGIATGIVAAAPAVDLVTERAAWCRRNRPTTWGEALGELVDELRLVLGDQHVQMTGAPRSRLLQRRGRTSARDVDPHEPAVSVTPRNDVLVVRLARLAGTSDDVAALERFVAASDQHFAHPRILVDLRGCTGGDDSYVLRWFAGHVPHACTLPETSQEWRVAGKVPSLWNWSVVQGTSAANPDLAPRPDDVMSTIDCPGEPLPMGGTPWHGTMLVVVDQNTASSGESGAWMLKHCMGAHLVGQSTRGMIEYGNIAPYLLPHAGALVTLATKHNDYGRTVELVGFPVDLPTDPTIGVDELVALFDASIGRPA